VSENVSMNLAENLTENLVASIQRTRTAAIALAKLPTAAKNAALEVIAVALEQNSETILTANQKDVAAQMLPNCLAP